MSSMIQTRTVPSAPSEQLRRDVRPVRTHLAAAVVCALVCFAPLGVAAVVYAGNARTRLALGDLDGARRASRMAAALCWASVAVIIACLLVVYIGVGGYPGPH
jgi:hypothetical protein